MSGATIPRSLVIGGDSFIGGRLMDEYRKEYPETPGTSRRAGTRWPMDLADPDLNALDLDPSIKEIVLVAALARVADCERDPEFTRKVNVDGTLKLIRQGVERGLKPVFFSTDYVFDGVNGPFAEDAPTDAPQTQYGRQKAEVERLLPEISGGNYLIIRPGKVFDFRKGDGTLYDEMAAKFAGGETVRAATDQFFAPVFIDDLVRGTIELQRKGRTGAFNLCMPEAASRYDMARGVLECMGREEGLLQSISLSDLGEEFPRPRRTDMSTDRTQPEFDFKFVTLAEAYRRVADNYSSTN